MRWPQTIMILLWECVLILALDYHGRPKTGNYTFWPYAVWVAAEIVILITGGFFD